MEGQVLDPETLVRAAIAGDDRRVGNQRVVDTRERHEVGLELGKVDVESTIETETGGDGADDLGDQTVQVLIAGTGDVQVAAADIVDSLVVHEEGAVRVFNGAVGGKDSVVWLHHSGGHTRSGIDGEFELGLLAVLSGKTLQQQRTETRTSTTTERVEDQETLERGTVV